MRKLFFMLAFVLVGTFAFANNNAELLNSNFEETSELVKTSINNESLTSKKIEIKELMRFDHCTITVSTLDSNGNVTSSITVTNHDGDCTAAKNLAYRILGLVQ
jgi:acyl CoA:acetate/3-ketoacid CoA transferase alpha subunit